MGKGEHGWTVWADPAVPVATFLTRQQAQAKLDVLHAAGEQGLYAEHDNGGEVLYPTGADG